VLHVSYIASSEFEEVYSHASIKISRFCHLNMRSTNRRS